jgi:hypothetical protein
MILTPEKVIPAKVEVTHDEFDIMCDYKILLENMQRAMDWKEVNEIAGISKAWLGSLADGCQALMDMVKLISEGV